MNTTWFREIEKRRRFNKYKERKRKRQQLYNIETDTNKQITRTDSIQTFFIFSFQQRKTLKKYSN